MNSRIVIEPEILAGKPIVKGTRISVEFVLELLASGMSVAEICKEYPQLTQEDVLAALAYTRRLLQHTEVYPTVEAA